MVPFLVAALAVGLAGGYAEALFLGVQTVVMDRIVFTGRHAPWMIPAAEALVCVAVAALAWGLGRFWKPLRGTGPAFGIPAFLVALALLLRYPRLHWIAALLLALGVAVQAGRVAARRPGRSVRTARVGAVAMVALVALTTAAFAQARRAARVPAAAAAGAPEGAPNVLLLVLDTVRARSMSLYGLARPTTPNLEALAARATVFDAAIAPAPWTLPSHASMFTGRHPHELSADWRRPLDGAEPTLAEHLARHGYRTAGFVANTGYCGWESGLDRGFSHYEDDPVSVRRLLVSSSLVRTLVMHPLVRAAAGSDEHFVRKSAREVNDGFLDWLAEGRDDPRPFFAFLNYYDAHGPYMPPEPYRSRFAAGEPRGGLSPLHRWNGDPSGPPPGHRVMAAERAAYEAAIAYVDDRIGELLDELGRRGLLERTVVVVTSDHGEEFGEHGVYDHGNSLYPAALRVPLLVSWPGVVPEGVRIRGPVSLRGLARAVARLTGVEDAAPFPDERLADALSGDVPEYAPVLAEVTHATGLPDWFPVSAGDMASLTSRRWHYMRNGDGTEELFDLRAEPEGRRDLAASPGTAAVRRRYAALLSEASPLAASCPVSDRAGPAAPQVAAADAGSCEAAR